MKLIRDISNLPDALRGGAVAIGNFDGVHVGHARIVERLLARARDVGGPAIVFTFDPHPVRLLRPAHAPPPLTWTERKAERLVALGVDSMIAYPTDEELLRLAPDEFFERIVRQRLDARAMVEGPNFRFGHRCAGTIDELRRLCDRARITLEVVEPLSVDGEIVSSSRVRKLLANGDVATAAKLLARPYRIRGMVVHGAGRGAKIGFPTANIEAIDTLVPAEGVYAGRASTGVPTGGVASTGGALAGSGESWPAAINIGPNPTFDEYGQKVEVHLLGCDRPLYGEALEVDFLARLRDIQPFADVDALRDQLARDVDRTRDIVRDAAVPQ